MKLSPPCKGCEQRRAGCHALCELYKAWSEKRTAEIRRVMAAKYAGADALLPEGAARTRKRYHKHRRK
jgi:hypothetical protein